MAQNLEDMLGFLSKEPKETVPLPVGGDFVSSGFVGPWRASTELWMLMSQGDYNKGELPYQFRNLVGGWYSYYFVTTEAAELGAEFLGSRYAASRHWVFQVPTADVINFASEEGKAKWGSQIILPCRVTGLKSRKYRHEMHFVTLPSVVASVATLLGYSNPGFDIAPLMNLEDELPDEKQTKLIGNDKDGYEGSLMFEQREALWLALGEKNPEAYLEPGSLDHKGRPSPYAMTSPQLATCFKAVNIPWPEPVWCRVVTVSNPHVDGHSKAGKRLILPTVTEMWPDEASARAAVGEVETPQEGKPGGRPDIPTAWVDMPDRWRDQMENFKRKVSQGTPVEEVYRETGGKDVFGASLPEVLAWLPHVEATESVEEDIPF